MRLVPFLTRSTALLLVLPLIACGKDKTPTATEELTSDNYAAGSPKQKNGEVIPFSEAQVFIEFNTTANDMGFQLFLDAEGWEDLTVTGPGVNNILEIGAEGPLGELGITELRFESEEPTPEEVLALFPTGEYRFRGTTVDGATLVGASHLSHQFLTPPTFTPTRGTPVDPANAVVTWNTPGAQFVEIIIEDDEGSVFDVTVPGSISSLNIPPQFLARNTEYKLEVLAIGDNRNRTISEGIFRTLP